MISQDAGGDDIFRHHDLEFVSRKVRRIIIHSHDMIDSWDRFMGIDSWGYHGKSDNHVSKTNIHLSLGRAYTGLQVSNYQLILGGLDNKL